MKSLSALQLLPKKLLKVIGDNKQKYNKQQEMTPFPLETEDTDKNYQSGSIERKLSMTWNGIDSYNPKNKIKRD